MSKTAEAVQSAADDLVGAFFRHDREAYFAAFAPDASFIFHNLPERLDSRDAYLAHWQQWEEAHGLRIEGGDSSEPAVATHGSMAVFSHRMTTRLQFDGHSETRRERETLVFRKDKSGRWLALHCHLSLDPSHEPT